MNIDLDFLKNKLVGQTIPKPISGTLSGHAAGEPFDKYVCETIKEKYPNTLRQYEYLNDIYRENSDATTAEKRLKLIRPNSLAFLLNRGKQSTKDWGADKLFKEKQNDTADIITIEDDFINLIDVKTFNVDLEGQPPNIISAYKLARMCALMIEDSNFSSYDITYIGISWKAAGNKLKCTDVNIRELFKTDPSLLYINWAAAMQIQFHVDNLNQDYTGDAEQWCRDYLKHFTQSAKERSEKMLEKFVYPFENI